MWKAEWYKQIPLKILMCDFTMYRALFSQKKKQKRDNNTTLYDN